MKFMIVLVIGVAFSLGIALGSYSHPYEVCERKYGVSGAGYVPVDDYLLECVWLLKNQPALR